MVDRLHEALVGLTNLQHLNLEDTRLNLLPDDLTKLRYLNLSNLRNMQEDTFDSLINHICSNLFDLEHLDLSANYDIKRVPESICNLVKLHTLGLSRCNLKKIPKSIHTIGSLKFLFLKGCDRFFRIPQLGGNPVSLPKFLVRARGDESSSNLALLQPTYPVELQITKLENVKSAGEAHSIKLIEKQSLQDLVLEWTRGVERFVDDKMLLEKLVPPSTLRKLEICAYNSISFPAWVVGQLPNLQFLVLRDMGNLEEWNTSYSSGEECVFQKVEIHGCPMLRIKPHLPKSKSWVIEHSDNVLSSWDDCTVSHTNTSSSSSPVTTWLSVQYCKVPRHQWRLFQLFPGLPSLSIHNCGDLTGSPEITQRLSSVETLCLGDKHMEELPKWLGELTSLRNLDIRSGDGVMELNENMRQLTKLQSLELNLCNNITLPHWLGELTSLKELNIAHNGVLRSLLASIQ